MAADPLTKSTVDDFFNADFSDFDDDPFADKPTAKDSRDDKAVLSPRAGAKRRLGEVDKENDGLGLDEEVKITKKRKPIAKLDEARLLSEPGIPKLRAITRSGQLMKKLRMKGKGHEFTDAARLLNHFQLWLDNLYPRAKFADALQLVEKAGHTKRMHIFRTEWINEGKPGYKKYEDVVNEETLINEPDLFGTAQTTGQANKSLSGDHDTTTQSSNSIFGNGLGEDALFIPDANRPTTMHEDDVPDDDELENLLAANDDPAVAHPYAGNNATEDDSEGEDDLDALLAEQETVQHRSAPIEKSQARTTEYELDEDGLDALLAEQEVRDTGSAVEQGEPALVSANNSLAQTQSDIEDEDDLETLLAQQRHRSKPITLNPDPSLPTPQPTSSPVKAATPRGSRPVNRYNENAGAMVFSSSPMPNNPEEIDLDDLDALLASQEDRMNTSKPQNDNDKTPRASKIRAAEEMLLSSSPVPNEDSQ